MAATIFGKPSHVNMTASESPWHPANEVERLLCSLAGVVSARVVANPFGRLDEIHVLATPLHTPKQVVRNVESALAAGLGIIVDRRIVSVAQIRQEAIEPLFADETFGLIGEASGGAEIEPSAGKRIVFVRWDAHNRPSADAECRVTVRRGERTYSGAGTAGTSLQGRALAAARAVFAALAEARDQDDLVLEDASIVEALGRTFVMVTAAAVKGRHTQPLTGVAALERSPEEAAILASFQATNRWSRLDD